MYDSIDTYNYKVLIFTRLDLFQVMIEKHIFNMVY